MQKAIYMEKNKKHRKYGIVVGAYMFDTELNLLPGITILLDDHLIYSCKDGYYTAVVVVFSWLVFGLGITIRKFKDSTYGKDNN